jgi:rhamnulokinase
MDRYLAIDLGASNGRHIVGWLENGEIQTQVVYGFENGVKKQDNRLVWDIENIFQNVVEGIKKAVELFPDIKTLAIDTWGVDYVLFKGDKELFPCYAYRDHRTEKTIPLVHEKVPFAKLFAKTGIQFNSFNTIYQLYDDLLCGRLEGATDFLAIPEYLSYRLTGVKKKEYTFATTTGLVNAESKQFDLELVKQLGFPQEIFKTLYQPGEVYGSLLPQIKEIVGKDVLVIMCASHDTASAVEGIPVEDLDAPYISSGTWSILGVKEDTPHTDEISLKNECSNEGGVGYIRYQKNTMGMWMVQSLRKELCPDKDYSSIAEDAKNCDYDQVVDANDGAFFSPDSMKGAIDGYLKAQGKPLPSDINGYFKCAYVSIAQAYKKVLKEIQNCTGKTYDKIYIVGGGAKNVYLNALTEQICKVKVQAFPIEATALGNLKIQIKKDK